MSVFKRLLPIIIQVPFTALDAYLERKIVYLLRHALLHRSVLLARGAQLVLLLLTLFPASSGYAQNSVARQWNDVLLNAIRKDFARPTVHARNLFHAAIAMYDTWAVYDETAGTLLLGKIVHGFACDFDGIAVPADIRAAREEALSYAV